MASTEAARAEAFASQADKSREIAAGHVQQALVIARDIRTVRTAIDQQLRAISIPFRWVGSQLELQNALGEWVVGPDLLGPGIVSVAMDGNGHLIFTDRSGAMTDVGKVRPEGDVHGPDGAVDGNFAAFDSETGKLVKDSGKSAADFADKVHSHPVSDLSDASSDGRTLITADDFAAMRVLLELVKGTAAGNIPVLDGSGKLSTSMLPALAITETFVVASQSAMLALTAQTGDVAIRTDLNKSFILSGSPGTLADWKELLAPLDAVLSVAGLTGPISDTALRSALSLVVGTDVQAYNAKLAALAGLTGAADKLPYFTGASAMGLADLSPFVRGILGSADEVAFRTAIGAGTRGVNAVSATKTDTFALATTDTWTDVTGLSVTITPADNTKKILVNADVNVGNTGSGAVNMLRIVRGAVAIGVGDAASSRKQSGGQGYNSSISAVFPVALSVLDAPATNAATTYKVQMLTSNTTAYINRSGTDADNNTSARTASTIAAIEVQ